MKRIPILFLILICILQIKPLHANFSKEEINYASGCAIVFGIAGITYLKYKKNSLEQELLYNPERKLKVNQELSNINYLTGLCLAGIIGALIVLSYNNNTHTNDPTPIYVTNRYIPEYAPYHNGYFNSCIRRGYQYQRQFAQTCLPQTCLPQTYMSEFETRLLSVPRMFPFRKTNYCRYCNERYTDLITANGIYRFYTENN